MTCVLGSIMFCLVVKDGIHFFHPYVSILIRSLVILHMSMSPRSYLRRLHVTCATPYFQVSLPCVPIILGVMDIAILRDTSSKVTHVQHVLRNFITAMMFFVTLLTTEAKAVCNCYSASIYQCHMVQYVNWTMLLLCPNWIELRLDALVPLRVRSLGLYCMSTFLTWDGGSSISLNKT